MAQGQGDRSQPRDHMPSAVSPHLSVFDRFATWASAFVSRAWFFVVCVVVVLLWAPTYLLVANVDTWQLIIQTLTTIVTFLLVALLQNTQKRGNEAVQRKLNAIAEGVAELMEHHAAEGRADLATNSDELRAAVGLEHRQSTS